MDKKTIDAYNRLAKEYDGETIDFWKSFPESFISRFAELIDGRVLNIGSGPGRDGLLLRKEGLEVVCLDASEEMVRLSSEQGLESVAGDFNNLPFPDGAFGGVWAYTSLLHIPKAEVAQPLAEIKRVLKNDGIFALGMIEGGEELYYESSGMKEPRWFSFYTQEELEKLLHKNGFEILYFEDYKPGLKKKYLNFISKARG